MLTVRFTESERYDIISDQELVRFMAITGTGSYTAETPCYPSSQRRKRKEEFKQYVINCMQEGIAPHEFEWEEDNIAQIEYVE